MLGPRIQKIEIQGFRAFGREMQTLDLNSSIAMVWGPNSQGKTSLAEAFEFLLTGQISRRELMASSQDEFADALRNAHMPPTAEVFVRAEIMASDSSIHTVRRSLAADYSKKQGCQTTLEIDGRTASEHDLASVGIVLSQPPLRAPVLAQHTLAYLFSARPQDRASYFKALLEVTDLEAFRNAVAALEAETKPPDLPILAQLTRAAAVPQGGRFISGLQAKAPPSSDIIKALHDALGAVIVAAGGALAKAAGSVGALENSVDKERRSRRKSRSTIQSPTATRTKLTVPRMNGSNSQENKVANAMGLPRRLSRVSPPRAVSIPASYSL